MLGILTHAARSSRNDAPGARIAPGAAGQQERDAQDLLAYAENRDPRARERLILSYLPLAKAIARRFDRGGRVPLDDLEQVAAIGLIKALDRYDPANGAALTTYAVATMQGEIRRYFRDHTWTVRPPRELQERAVRIEREREQLTHDLGRTPTAKELATRVGCTLEEFLDASEAALARGGDSLDRPVAARDGRASTLAERLGAEDPALDAAETSATLEDLLGRFSERDRRVLRLRLCEDLTQAEIGRQVDLSQMQVSRILRAAVAQLAQHATAAPDEVVNQSGRRPERRTRTLWLD